MRSTSLTLPDLETTHQLSERLASAFKGGEMVTLSGDLGAGKTTFTRGLSEALGCTRLASSPTYTLFSPCPGGRLPLLHGDLYRLGDETELEDLGFSEMLDEYRSGIVVLEWGERFPDLLPEDRLRLHFEYGQGDEERTVLLVSSGPDSDRLSAAVVPERTQGW